MDPLELETSPEGHDCAGDCRRLCVPDPVPLRSLEHADVSNDKVAATFHGEDKALEMTIQAAEVRGYACGHGDARYRVRPSAEDWAAARRWAARYGYRTQQPETTGEHTKAKLADDAYAASQGGSLFGGVPGLPVSEERYANAYMRSLGPPLRLKPALRRGWSPTHRELLYAGGLALAMLTFAVYFFLTHPM